ncbi:hypothetical protein Hanom_Chr16g01481491 [Helianthus anomalus]
MAIKVKPHGPRCRKFEIWTKMAKVPKAQGPKWQFTLFFFYNFIVLSVTLSSLSIISRLTSYLL